MSSKKIVIEQTRDLIYLKFVATDLSPKIISPTTSLWINTSLVSSGQTLYQATSWRLILQSSMLQLFTAESSRELSDLRKLNNKQRQVSMFLILLFKWLTQLPFVFFSAPFLNPLFSLSPSLLSVLINSLSS